MYGEGNERQLYVEYCSGRVVDSSRFWVLAMMMIMIPRLTPCYIIYLERERRGEHRVREIVYLKQSLQQVIPYKIVQHIS